MIDNKDIAAQNDARFKKATKKLSKLLKNHFYLIIMIFAFCICNIPLGELNTLSYSDADGYMRAMRIHHWLLSPSFFETPIYESNSPFGEINHWTRPMDILWSLCSLPFIHKYPLKEAVFYGGLFFSPLMLILTMFALCYGLKRQFNIFLVIVGLAIFSLSEYCFGYFSYTKADHHSLLTLLTIYAEALCLCWLKKRQTRYLRLIGFSLALATATAIEGFILYLLFLSFFTYLYIYKNISLTPSAKISKYFAIALTFFWFTNPPYEGWFYPDNGRISILFVTISWLMFIMLWIMSKSHIHTISLKILAFTAFSLGIALALVTFFGSSILQSPLNSTANISFISRIAEMYSINQLPFYKIYASFSFPFVALLLNIYLLKRKTHQRILLLNICLGLPLFILTLYANRFLQYSYLYTIIPFLSWFDYLYKKSPYAQNKSYEFPVYIEMLIIFVLLFQLTMFSTTAINKTHQKLYSEQLCQQISETGGTLVTDIFKSPRFIWECNVNTVGTPYHRNIDGIIDNDNILMATNDEQLLIQIFKHQITQILLFSNYDEKYYSMKESNKDKLYYRLLKEENIPPYLIRKETDLPNAYLYEVKL